MARPCSRATRSCAALYVRAEVVDAVRERFGDGVIDGVGEVDRAAIAARVFADAGERRWLEGLLLPLIQVRVRALARRAAGGRRSAAGARGADPVRGRDRGPLRHDRAGDRARRPARAAQAGCGRPDGGRSCPRRRRRCGVTWCTRTPGRSTTSTAGWPAWWRSGCNEEVRGPGRRAGGGGGRVRCRRACYAAGLVASALVPARSRRRSWRIRDKYQLDPALVAAVIYKESRFDADARVAGRRRRPDAAAARHRPGHRHPHRRHGTSTRAPTCSIPT